MGAASAHERTAVLPSLAAGGRVPVSALLVQVTILQKPILESKTLLLPLPPFLVVEVDVSALQQRRVIKVMCNRVCRFSVATRGAVLFRISLTCSNSSLIIFGSSCLWNHIMYLVWNLQLCFFKALAARYWALVPSM